MFPPVSELSPNWQSLNEMRFFIHLFSRILETCCLNSPCFFPSSSSSSSSLQLSFPRQPQLARSSEDEFHFLFFLAPAPLPLPQTQPLSQPSSSSNDAAERLHSKAGEREFFFCSHPYDLPIKEGILEGKKNGLLRCTL